MDTPNKQSIAIFYLEKDRATVYIQGVEKPIEIRFPKDIVHNLDIVDKEKFKSILTSPIEKHELKPAHMLLVVSTDCTFDKDIQDTPVSLQHVAREDFLGLIPFEEVLSKTFRIKNTVKIVAANGALLKTLVDIFLENNWIVSAVVPLAVMVLFPDFKDGFEKTAIFKRFDFLKQYTIMDFSENQGRIISYSRPKFASLQFILLIGTFGLLLVILSLLLFARQTGRTLPF